MEMVQILTHYRFHYQASMFYGLISIQIADWRPTPGGPLDMCVVRVPGEDGIKTVDCSTMSTSVCEVNINFEPESEPEPGTEIAPTSEPTGKDIILHVHFVDCSMRNWVIVE